MSRTLSRSEESIDSTQKINVMINDNNATQIPYRDKNCIQRTLRDRTTTVPIAKSHEYFYKFLQEPVIRACLEWLEIRLD